MPRIEKINPAKNPKNAVSFGLGFNLVGTIGENVCQILWIVAQAPFCILSERPGFLIRFLLFVFVGAGLFANPLALHTKKVPVQDYYFDNADLYQELEKLLRDLKRNIKLPTILKGRKFSLEMKNASKASLLQKIMNQEKLSVELASDGMYMFPVENNEEDPFGGASGFSPKKLLHIAQSILQKRGHKSGAMNLAGQPYPPRPSGGRYPLVQGYSRPFVSGAYSFDLKQVKLETIVDEVVYRVFNQANYVIHYPIKEGLHDLYLHKKSKQEVLDYLKKNFNLEFDGSSAILVIRSR